MHSAAFGAAHSVSGPQSIGARNRPRQFRRQYERVDLSGVERMIARARFVLPKTSETSKMPKISDDLLSRGERPNLDARVRVSMKPNGEPLIGEDIDFVYRAHQLGYRCMFQPRALGGQQKTVDLSGVGRMITTATRRATERSHG